MSCKKQNIKKRLTLEDFVEAKQDICSLLYLNVPYKGKDKFIAASNQLKPLPSYIIKELGKDEDIQKSAKHAIANELTSEAAGQGKSDINIFKLKDLLKLPDSIIEDAALEGISWVMHCINEDFVGESLKIKKRVNLSDETFRKAAIEGVASNLTVYRSEGLDRVIEIKTRLNLPEDINLYLDYINHPVKTLIPTFDLYSISQLIGFWKNNRKFMLKVEQNQKLYLEKKDLPAIADLHISLFEAEEIKSKSSSTDLVAWASNKDFKQLFERLKLFSDEWKETIPGTVHAMPMPQNYTWGGGPIGNSYSYDPIWVPNEWLTISSIFQEGAEVFGYENMFKYMYRKGLSRHDALFTFKNLLELCKSSGLTHSEFYNNILQQVKMDNSSYNEGTAHHYLNSIVKNFNFNFDQVISAAKKYTNLSCLQELLNVLSSKKEVFASWKNLKKYDELSQLLNRAEILSQFEKLKSTGKQKLYSYIEKLAFHPSINTSKVLEFWQDSKKFLGESDDYSPSRDLLPSSYLEIPHLDLSAEELRDALVEGKLDCLQAFTPLEITYRIPKENFSLQEAAKTALGSRKNNVKGKAKSPPKLFYNLNNLLKTKSINIQEYISGKKVDKLLENKIENLVYDESFGMPRTEELQVYTAKIHLKSDPEGVVAGDDTACCMPFGSDNNTNYTFNPNTAIFTLQIEKEDTKRRTIAQSVLTKNKDIKIHKSLDYEKSLAEQLPESMLTQEPAVLVCDNVEVAPNHTDKKKVIEKVYRDFFKEYLNIFGKKQNLITDRIIIGRGFSDALTHLPKVENTYTPQTPIIYSDNKGKESSILNLNSPDDNLNKTVKPCKAKKMKKEYLNMKVLEYLTFEDSLEAAYLESRDANKASVKGLAKITNELIAKDINNIIKNRPDMSLKYKSEDNKVEGYIITYEGRLTKGQEKSIPIVLVSSITATSQEVREKLIQSFVQIFKQNYSDKNINTPLYLEVRESTYHGFLQEQIIKAGKNLGIAFETENLQRYKRNKEEIHPILIKPVK